MSEVLPISAENALLPMSLGSMAGGILSWIASLGFFAKSSDLQSLRASVAETYWPRSEAQQRLEMIESKLDRLMELLRRQNP
jgi:hypothetical protein